MGDELLSLFDFAFERLTNRLEGLSDEEYLWQPAPEQETPAQVTTIAWRLCHLSDAIARHPFNGFLRPGWTPSPPQSPLTADAARTYLHESFQEWRDLLVSVDPQSWSHPLGPTAGPYADSTLLGVALHNADEFIHHSAEVALLRDLYTHRAHLRT